MAENAVGNLQIVNPGDGGIHGFDLGAVKMPFLN
jgi:hypothetical protein